MERTPGDYDPDYAFVKMLQVENPVVGGRAGLWWKNSLKRRVYLGPLLGKPGGRGQTQPSRLHC